MCYSDSVNLDNNADRHGVVTTMLVASAVGIGWARDEGWSETRACGRLGDVCGEGGGGVGVCTVQRPVVIKHRVVPALP